MLYGFLYGMASASARSRLAKAVPFRNEVKNIAESYTNAFNKP